MYYALFLINGIVCRKCCHCHEKSLVKHLQYYFMSHIN
jgi:hypothetical protein